MPAVTSSDDAAWFPRLERVAARDACGAAVLDGVLVGLFDVATDPAGRRRGHARRVTAAFLGGGAAAGAHHAYLRVAEGNLQARALYDGLGFRSIDRNV